MDEVEVLQIFFTLFLVEMVSDAYLGFIDIHRQLQQEVDGLVELTANIRGNCTFEIVAIFADAGLFATDVLLRFISCEIFKSEQNLHVITFLLDVLHLLLEIGLPFKYFLVKTSLDLSVKIKRQSIVVLKLVLSVLYQLFRITNNLV
jgi:hypothetical protein